MIEGFRQSIAMHPYPPLKPKPRSVAAALVLALTLCSCGKPTVPLVRLEGAGASFPAPLYAKWIQAYEKQNPGVRVLYEPVGSGGGVKAFVDHSGDFGASDTALTEDDMERVDPSLGIQLLPMAAGCIAMIYNLPEVMDLKLSRKAYAGITLGNVTVWNDPLIAKDNPGAKLPSSRIELVVRSDTSGVTLALTRHLAELDTRFASRIGISKTPDWVVGTHAKGSDGVIDLVRSRPGTIGYVALSSVMGKGLQTAVLENRSGRFVNPSTASGQAALESVELPQDLLAWLPDPANPDAYPMVTYTWLLCYKRYEKAKRDALVGWLTYSLEQGQREAESLGFIPLPKQVQQKVKTAALAIGST